MTTESTRSVEPMTPNTTLENTGYTMSPSPVREGLKRKAAEGVVNAEDKENGGAGNADKKAKVDTTASLVELKGRKLMFKQETSSRKLPRRQLLNFEGWLLDEVEAGRPITEVPEEFWGLVVMAGHELTSSNETMFVKHLKSALNAVKDGQDPLPNETLSPLIPKLFTLHQYGFLPSDFAPSSSTTKVPAALQIRCWEANDLQKYFPSDQLEEIMRRKKEREAAREECLRILNGLDDIEKLELIKGDKADKSSLKEVKEKTKTEEVEASPRIGRRQEREGTANTVESRGRSTSPTKKSKMTPEEEEAARVKKEEREAKKAEIAEKKAAKEKEKERREAVVAKQAKAMLGFFKSKAPTTPPISRASEAGPSKLKGDDGSPVKGKGSDYSRVFRLMTQRPNVHVAEINRWIPQKASINGESSTRAQETDVQNWNSRDFVNDHLRKHGKQTSSSRKHLPKGLKSLPPHGSVADVYATLEDAEDPRAVLSQLKDRRRFPWKILAFDQQTRPPYCGTFTKKSVVVGPRTPFAQDPIFDYSYDSSDDWVDDEGGEDVDDFGDGEPKEDEEDEDEDEDDGEFDDWLDDAEDVEFTPVDGDDPLAGPEQARLPMKVVKKSRDVPKKVVKLTPSWKGPIWETNIGEEGTDGMEAYRIQLLNDTPHSIDPFTFSTPEPVQQFKSSFSTTAIGTSLNVRCLLSVEPIAIAPPPPPAPERPMNVPNSSSIDSKPIYNSSTPPVNGDASTTIQPKSRPMPKVGFPEEHLPELYRLIDGSKKIKPDLISLLRERFDNVTTKVAIEAKLREVAVKEGKAKESQWKVKPEAWIAVGITPPAPAPIASLAPSVAPTTTTKTVADFFSSPAPPSSESKNTLGGTIDEPMVIDA